MGGRAGEEKTLMDRRLVFDCLYQLSRRRGSNPLRLAYDSKKSLRAALLLHISVLLLVYCFVLFWKRR